jgi:ABC-type phosphate transport system substrate-binding protein
VTIECDESLLPVIRYQAEDFHNTYPEATVTVRPAEAREAVVNFVNDSVRVVVLGRQFNKEELEFLRAAQIEYEGYKVALDAVIAIVNLQRQDTTLRITELDSIYGSTRTRWGGKSAPVIDAYIGDINSSTDEVFRSAFLGGKPLGATVIRLKSSEEIIEKVKKNPNAIGLIGLSWLGGHDQEVRVCRLGGGAYRPVMQAKAMIEGTKQKQQRIVVTEPPATMSIPAFIAMVRELVEKKELPNVTTVRNETEGTRTRIVLDIAAQADADEELKALLQHTQTVDTTLVPGQFFSPAQAHVFRRYYPLAREVYMYTREVRRDVSYGFIAFVRDRKGQQNFVNHGLVPTTMPVRMVTTTSEKVYQE